MSIAIHPKRPARTLVKSEWDDKARQFAEKHNVPYVPGDSFADVFKRFVDRTRLDHGRPRS